LQEVVVVGQITVKPNHVHSSVLQSVLGRKTRTFATFRFLPSKVTLTFLIGANVPEALWAEAVRNRECMGQDVIKTVLGWSLWVWPGLRSRRWNLRFQFRPFQNFRLRLLNIKGMKFDSYYQ